MHSPTKGKGRQLGSRAFSQTSVSAGLYWKAPFTLQKDPHPPPQLILSEKPLITSYWMSDPMKLTRKISCHILPLSHTKKSLLSGFCTLQARKKQHLGRENLNELRVHSTVCHREESSLQEIDTTLGKTKAYTNFQQWFLGSVISLLASPSSLLGH